VFKNSGGLRPGGNQFIDASLKDHERLLVEERRRKRDRKLLGSTIFVMAISVIGVPLTLAGNILWTLHTRSPSMR
jgi:hypothetical protein